jgi:hypothetical protein
MLAGGTYYPFYDDCNICGLYKKPQSEENTMLFDAEIFPNPTESSVNITTINDDSKTINVQVTDAMGKIIEIKDLALVNHIAYLPAMQAKGKYILTIKNAKNEKVVKKLIVN